MSMKNNNGWLTIIVCGAFAFTAIGFGYTYSVNKDISQDHKEDMQLISQKIDTLCDRMGSMDKKITQANTYIKLVLKDAYGILRDDS